MLACWLILEFDHYDLASEFIQCGLSSFMSTPYDLAPTFGFVYLVYSCQVKTIALKSSSSSFSMPAFFSVSPVSTSSWSNYLFSHKMSCCTYFLNCFIQGITKYVSLLCIQHRNVSRDTLLLPLLKYDLPWNDRHPVDSYTHTTLVPKTLIGKIPYTHTGIKLTISTTWKRGPHISLNLLLLYWLLIFIAIKYGFSVEVTFSYPCE